jgi:hypothetical protein
VPLAGFAGVLSRDNDHRSVGDVKQPAGYAAERRAEPAQVSGSHDDLVGVTERGDVSQSLVCGPVHEVNFDRDVAEVDV